MKGKTIEELSKKFNCTKNTITRHLKKNLSENDFRTISQKSNSKKKNIKESNKYFFTEAEAHEEVSNERKSSDLSLHSFANSFMQIADNNIVFS